MSLESVLPSLLAETRTKSDSLAEDTPTRSLTVPMNPGMEIRRLEGGDYIDWQTSLSPAILKETSVSPIGRLDPKGATPSE